MTDEGHREAAVAPATHAMVAKTGLRLTRRVERAGRYQLKIARASVGGLVGIVIYDLMC